MPSRRIDQSKQRVARRKPEWARTHRTKKFRPNDRRVARVHRQMKEMEL